MKTGMVAGVVSGVLALGLGLGAAVLRSSGTVQAQAGAGVAAAPSSHASDAVQAALLSGKPTVAEFGANACASCREMKPILEALQRDHGERIAVVNVDLLAQKEADYIRRYRIQLMPTQVFFDTQGREIGRHMGRISGEDILARLQPGGAQ
jgi:thioredoxin 1